MYYGYRNWQKDYKALPEEVRKKLEKTYPRKDVTQRQSIYSTNIRSIVKEAEEFAKEWGKKLDDVRFEHHVEEDYGSSSSRANLEVPGLETDEQWQIRLIQTYESNKHNEEYDRQQYERLKAKFGQ